MRFIECEQGTDQWLQIRLGKFTASTAQAIANNGTGLETLAFEKAAEILTGKQKDEYTNKDMDRGHELEMEARNAYEIETGNVVKTVGFCEVDEYTGCSPDGIVGDSGLIEIKCPNNVTFTRYLYDKKIDPKYFYQMQFQMWATGRKWCDYVVYNPNFKNSCIIARVDRDEAAISKIKTGVEKGKELLCRILEKTKEQ